MKMDDLLARTTEIFDKEMAAREKALVLSRQIIRSCANSIRTAHRGESQEARALLEKAGASLRDCQETLRDHPRFYYAGFLQNAEKEFVEASATISLIEGGEIPDLQALGVSHVTYLLGLGEAVGELRRHILDRLRTGRFEGLEQLLMTMEDIYSVLASVDYPDSVTGGLRRVADQDRSLLERTRGDLTVALGRESLRRSLEQVEKRLS